MSGFAWVTLATNDSYSLGALVLAHSLKQAGTAHQLVVLVTPGVTNVMRKNLADVFNVVEEVNLFDSKDEANLRLLKRPELGVTFTKLHCWRLTQFEKCVFLDADVLVLVNSDELFERDEFSAAPDVGWPDCFNSGVFVYKPSMDTYNKLVDFALQKGSFDGGDQGLLNAFFSDWAHKDISKHLPFIYNMCSTACYSYLPAFKYYGGNVKIVHFIGPAKPWLQYFDTESRIVHPSPDLQHLQEVLQRWWDVFCSLIHPKLTPDMSGLAGAFAQFTLGVKRSAAQDALENHLRRQAWEVGNIDYMGRDSFDNIWSKICQTLSTTQLESVKDGAVFSSDNQQVPEVPQEGSTAAQTEVTESPTPVCTESPVPPPTDVKIQEEVPPPTNTEEQASKPDVVPDPEPRKEEIPPPVEAIIEPPVLTETVVAPQEIAEIPQTVIAESQEAQIKQEVLAPETEPIKEVIPSEPEPVKEIVSPEPEPESVKEVVPPQPEPESVKEVVPPQPEPEPQPEPVKEVLPPQAEPEPVKEIPPPQSEPEPVKEIPPPQSEPEPVKEIPPPQSEPEPVKEIPPPQSEPEPVKEIPPAQSEPEPVKEVVPPEPIKEIPQPKAGPAPETQVKEVAPVEEVKPKPTKREAKAPKSPDSSKIAKTPKVETTLESPKAEAGPESPSVPESPKPEDVVEAEASAEVPKSDTKPKEVRKVKKKVKKVPKAEGDASEGTSKK